MELLLSALIGILSGYFYTKVYFHAYEKGAEKANAEKQKEGFIVNDDNRKDFEKFIKWATFTGKEKVSDKN